MLYIGIMMGIEQELAFSCNTYQFPWNTISQNRIWEEVVHVFLAHAKNMWWGLTTPCKQHLEGIETVSFGLCYTFSSQQGGRGKEACSNLSYVTLESLLGFTVSWHFLCVKYRAARQGPFQPKNSMVQLKNINDVHFRYFLWLSLREKCPNFNFLSLIPSRERQFQTDRATLFILFLMLTKNIVFFLFSCPLKLSVAWGSGVSFKELHCFKSDCLESILDQCSPEDHSILMSKRWSLPCRSTR